MNMSCFSLKVLDTRMSVIRIWPETMHDDALVAVDYDISIRLERNQIIHKTGIS